MGCLTLTKNLFIKCCVCILLVHFINAKVQHRGKGAKISGIDLLNGLSFSTNIHQSTSLNSHGWTSPKENSGDITHIRLHKIIHKKTREITIDVIGFSYKKSLTTLFGIYLKYRPLPLFEISIDAHRRKVYLRYQGETSFQRVTVGFGKELADWTVFSASVNKTHFTVTVGCDKTKSVLLRQRLKRLPRKAFGVVGSGKKSENRFLGHLFEARVYSGSIDKRILLCSQPVNLNSFLAQSKGYVNDAAINGDRILLLEQQITQLNRIVDGLKQENSNLTGRVAELELCGDCTSDCTWDGQLFDEGETWTPNECTVCICKNKKSDCLIRTDVPSCQVPCSSNMCMNEGQCFSFDNMVAEDYQCQCQPPYDGPHCEYKENPCVWPRESGICNQSLPRFYYDPELQQCLLFNYSGCGGNINNYDTLEGCQAVTIKGACCFRQHSIKAQDVLISSQNETFGCKEISLAECQSTHRTVVDDMKMEVISFYPGVSCKDAKCGLTELSCMIDDRKYMVGDKAVLGCQECTCMSSGQFVCSCSKKAERKEIRDMTSQELAQFQAAVQQLRLVGPGNPWEELRDIYMRHSMHANGGPYFLPWHRVFLRRLEQRLQEIDCSITLPYYEFVTDIGSFEEAIIWQPTFFGGNGSDGPCVIDHPFGLPGSWRPCITRNFDRNVNLPTMLELSLALASEDYKEMSRCLEAFVSYIHTYIGGEMATSAAPYDPVFYSIHAYIDMLYWLWQKKGDNKFNYPAEFSNIPMIPFNIPPSAIFDLEADLCVTYVLPSKGSPCNITEDPEKIPERGDVSPEGEDVFEGEFNTLGYNSEGYDRRGFDKLGFNKKGYNRDGYNRQGFDYNGYNRYGYNADRYSPYGYDNEGYDRDNMPDETGRYNAYGLDINCLDRWGLTTEDYDRYGFNIYGFDRDRCNYFNKGPYSTIQSQRIWNILLKQSKPFLMSLMRTCPGLKPLSHNWLQQYWITDIKDVSDIVKETSISKSTEKNSARFCFDIDDFVTPCGCDVGKATCTENPCQTTTCPSYPEASCRVDFCGSCRARWHLANGAEVDCFEERDFCQPNPCENGGTCVASIWPSEPQLTTCQCPPGFDGHYCQYKALEVCALPVSRGQCTKQESRWYFDPVTQTCVSFLYSGCGGNANNFVSRDFCEKRCKVGACCFRFPKRKNAVIGYDSQGYDRYGFNLENKNRRGDIRTEDNGIKTGRGRFLSSRYDEKGYDRNGYDSNGYDRFGLDKSGYDREGFNLLGNSRQGEYDGIIDYNEEGYDEEGYTRAGYNCKGTNRDGQNVYEVYSEFTYRCRPATLAQCQRLERDQGHEVVKFSPGRKCEEVNCTESCGCSHNGQSYSFGQTFKSGCQFCTCTYTGFVECICPEIYRRKEIRDLTKDEMRTYQNAVKQLSKSGYPSKWFQIAETYANYKPQAVGNSASLPWLRYYLSMIEKQLQEFDCTVTIPYYDWTLHAGNQQRSTIWAADMFGGDGSEINGCVEHHPFKDYYPPYWVPCLRRQFNTSVQLPDLVDIQYALNEESYERFRVSMEVYFDIFKSWVGGTMVSDYAPYDPLYISVAAFIDRIWWDWQNKNEDSLLNYPQEKRYIPMMPFKATPDDVMDSKKQVCVTYHPLSEAAVCNITQTNLNYNSLGYDRHGFNREGYDIEGYNVFGLDKDGNIDERGIYNKFGYDREGFKRNGYDKTGFDRFGFYVDGYNVDGYDSTGYDRSGYDRYGFDRTGVTPFGFHRNGTLLTDKVPANFDPYGYNRYGLNRYGLDRLGNDIFGFDTFGYDRRRCNRYFLGPMLVIIKRWAELELDKTEKPTMRIITRICPAITSLPEWRYTHNWLRRDAQLPLLEGIVGRAQQRVQGLIPPERLQSVTDDNIWLPLGPDRNLCFVTYYYEECPFGEFPVSCVDDLCSGRKCPGYPDAVCRVNRCGACTYEWYNGITGNTIECSGCVDRKGIDRVEGSTWSVSECETCTCQDGLVSCAETQCPPVTCSHPVKIKGQCCLLCNAGCDFNGQIYRNGQKFPSPSDKCQECSCFDGDVQCFNAPCPDTDLNCDSPTVLEGECCPRCLDCGIHGNGESWKETACQECTCLDGKVDCEAIRCIPPDCSHPWTPPGQCCPVCDGCTVDGRDLQSGESYRPEQCTECLCLEGTLQCDFLPCPIAPCLNPITPPGECCPRCDNECQYNFRTYRHMESFISRDDQCTNCTCDNGFVNCVPVTCPRMNLPCRRPLTLPGECCPTTCPKCIVDGVKYETGASWKSVNDPCETCRCDEGIPVCQRQSRCPVECDHGVVKAGECCSECTDCLFSGQYVRDGQVFVRPGDNCQQCTCSQGQVTCVTLGPCPRLPCRVTETPPGACCPQCKRCEYNGAMYSHGEIVSSDVCSRCTCLDGEVSCQRETCPVAQCRNPVSLPGQCCPVCLECQYEGKTYPDGQRFTPPRKPCLDCECRGGEVNCVSRESECPISRCTHPMKTRKQCCPTCGGCSFMRRRFRNGQKFVPPGSDNCKVCRCVEGSVECSVMGCPAVNCDNAVLVKGQCCPVCPMGCNVMGINYRDGQTFIDFMNRCQVCTCMMGQIRCMQMMTCPPVTCSHPANRPGNCCPSCSMCEQNSMQYRNGEQFTNPADPCQDCICSDGSIRCSPKVISCPRVRCNNPVLDPNTCCPACGNNGGCMYAGRQYLDGQEVPASKSECEVCECSGGLIDCRREVCPAVNCRHPGKKGCCDTCEVCKYNGMSIELGRQFPSPTDPCEECVCMAGTVECQRIYCDIPNCSNPSLVPGSCCPQCKDCTYQGLLFRDGENFQSPTNPCERCHCMKGSVACDRALCPKVNCQNPIQDGCCPRCTHCSYRSRRYENGVEFQSSDGCGLCRCVDGNVQCDSPNCPEVSCRHPIKNECCDECTDCQYQGKTIRNGQSIPDPSNECRQCVCRYGTVSCDLLPCQPVTCPNPTTGKCCPECQDCNYFGDILQHGDSTPSLYNPCEECKCVKGNIECVNKTCPPAVCTYPVKVGCCDSCGGCSVNGRVYVSNETVPMSKDSCETCVCRYGNLDCTRQQCPPVKCDNPRLGQCCPECPEDSLCSYDNKQYQDGEVFDDLSDKCSLCECYKGIVSCGRRQCQPVSCSNPVTTGCCPSCRDCSFQGEVVKHGEFTNNRNNSCDRCRCESGSIKCYGVGCPVVSCTHPVKAGCCDTCEACMFNGITAQQGKQFKHPNNPCQICTCSNGNVECADEPCPPINCLDPVMKDECCLTCPGPNNCEYYGREYRHEQQFRDDSDQCIVCTCQDGIVSCINECSEVKPCIYKGMEYEDEQQFRDEDKPCVKCLCRDGIVSCDDRCPEDKICSHKGNQYRDGQQFREGRDQCSECVCKNGVVSCNNRCPEEKGCIYKGEQYRDGQPFRDEEDLCLECLCRDGIVSCNNRCPTEKGCVYKGERYREGQPFRDEDDSCLECLCRDGIVSCNNRCPTEKGCVYKGERYRDGQPFRDEDDSCLECLCRDGIVSCNNRCPIEKGCVYKGERYRDGQPFRDEDDSCLECLCRDGVVSCDNRCPAQLCSYPYQGRCDGCYFKDLYYRNRQSFRDGCEDCLCSDGNVQCTPVSCPRVSCANPLTKDCCPVCNNNNNNTCNHGNRLLSNGETIPDARDPCGSCTCRDGSFSCTRPECPPISCKHPAMGQCCPECFNCQVGARKIPNGKVYPDPTNKCFLCMCKVGNINCEKRPCAHVGCTHPTEDECGCPKCSDGCQYEGLSVGNQQTFIDPLNKCNECVCRSGYVQCYKKACTGTCTHPADTDGCCPICNSCLYEGQIQVDGASFTSIVDPCQECVCQGGSVTCTQRRCPQVECDNPVAQPGECCAVCPECSYRGRYYREGQVFTSADDKCTTCTCMAGRVRCEKEQCSTKCSHPRPGACCPTCDLCFYEGKLYNNNSTFSPEPCTLCNCMNGSVTCPERVCPDLSCREQETRQGDCCPVCKGCLYNGLRYENGAEWLQRDDPCKTCTCTAGAVTCSTVQCVTPCASPVAVPGQCCPVCPSCRYNGVEYRDDESFSVRGNPCDVCLCQNGQLKCRHDSCPHLKDCPIDQQTIPEPGTCCPLCTALSSCTRERFGEIRRKKEDPCSFCVCDKFQWRCERETCKDLPCPKSVWVYGEGDCCPKCPACYDVSTNIYYQDGEEWMHRDNNCLSCACRTGFIDCAPIYCGPAECREDEKPVSSPNECCPKCRRIERLFCFYQGYPRQELEEWRPDDCTTCQCVAGSVLCNTQACDVPVCGRDDSLTVLPGQCCPICMPKPGTCLVYGDPHYRTFDGSTLHFQGTCKYIMAKDCDNEDFVLEVHHDDRGVNGVSWAQNFTLRTAGLKVDILQNYYVLINDQQVPTPYQLNMDISIERRDGSIFINTKHGVRLLWDGRSFAELTVPGNYKRKMCGLCGNFNGFPQDDMRTNIGKITNSAAVLGNSWKVADQLAGRCADATDADPCNAVSYRQRKEAATMCEVLSGPQFSACHRAVPVSPFYASCVYDLCACTNRSACLCDILTSYAKECAKAGVRLEWRSQTLCSIDCDSENGFIFDECGPVCQRTCDNWQTPLGDLTENCYRPCVASCQCTADKVVHNGKCITPQECPP